MTEKTPDIADQLAKLAALHQSGALSDEEFVAAKARVLATAHQPPGGSPVRSPVQPDETASERPHRYRSLIVSAALVVVVVVVVILGPSATRHRPTAGPELSLPAGQRVTVMERPVGNISAQSLQRAVRVMADRLSGMGIRDFSVQAQGGDIMVEPPRTNNGAQVLKALAQTGQLFFRPVDCILAPYVGARPGATTETPSEGTTTGPPGAGTSRASAICRLNSTEQKLYAPSHGNIHGVTPATYDTAGTTAVLADYAGYAYGRYVLGPAEMTGAIIKTAVANLNSHTNRWEVDNSMTPAGLALFNKYAAAHYACYAQDESNPHIAR